MLPRNPDLTAVRACRPSWPRTDRLLALMPGRSEVPSEPEWRNGRRSGLKSTGAKPVWF